MLIAIYFQGNIQKKKKRNGSFRSSLISYKLLIETTGEQRRGEEGNKRTRNKQSLIMYMFNRLLKLLKIYIIEPIRSSDSD